MKILEIRYKEAIVKKSVFGLNHGQVVALAIPKKFVKGAHAYVFIIILNSQTKLPDSKAKPIKVFTKYLDFINPED